MSNSGPSSSYSALPPPVHSLHLCTPSALALPLVPLPLVLDILEKSVVGVAAVDLKDRSCRKEVGNPVVTSVDVQATILE